MQLIPPLSHYDYYPSFLDFQTVANPIIGYTSIGDASDLAATQSLTRELHQLPLAKMLTISTAHYILTVKAAW